MEKDCFQLALTKNKLKMIMEELRDNLGGGLVATDIWSTSDSKSIAFEHDFNKPSTTIDLLVAAGAVSADADNFNKPSTTIDLLNEVTDKLRKTLKDSDFPKLGNYYFVNLANNYLILVLSVEAYQQYVLVDLSKTSMGILMSLALPNLLSSLIEAEAAVETEATANGKTAAAAEKPDQPRKKSALRELLDSLRRQDQ